VCEGVTFLIWGVKEIGSRVGLEISATARPDVAVIVPPAPPGEYTADMTTIFADSTLITADAA
jgi:hypothetical protein